MIWKGESLQFYYRLGGKPLVEAIAACHKAVQQRVKPRAPRADGVWQSPGAVLASERDEQRVVFQCERGWVEVAWIALDCVRVRLRTEDGIFTAPFSYAVQRVPATELTLDWTEDDEHLEMRSSVLVCRITKVQFAVDLETVHGQRICTDLHGMQWQDDGGVRLSLSLRSDESCYGTGMRASLLNLRGSRVMLWNTAPSKPYTRGTDPLYYNVQFYLGVHNDAAYGVLWDNPARGAVDMGAGTANELRFEGESGELRYYLLAGAEITSVLGRYGDLTGKPPMPPLWALGYQHGRFRHDTQGEVLALAHEIRARAIPCDVLYLDLLATDGFRMFTLDASRFPEPAQMIEELHALGFKVIAVICPAVKIDTDYAVYQSGIESDVFVKYPDGELFAGASWAGASHYPDFTDPVTRSWWIDQTAPLIEAGIDGFAIDLAEPLVIDGRGLPTSIPNEARHCVDERGGDHAAFHNVYAMQMARATVLALEFYAPEQRAVILTRAGCAGTQRYALAWTGANSGDWDHLRLSISMMLTMGLSGAPLTGADIGGYYGMSNGELFTRWLQAACLTPVFRSTSFLDTPPQAPWSFGQPNEVLNRVTMALRYRLLPYLYSVIAQCREYGAPVMRPLFSLEPHNEALRGLDDAFLLGDALLVAPVLTPGTVTRAVYLPVGLWYDYWTNHLISGGKNTTVPAPLERLPLFVRAGSVVPLWEDRQYVGELPLETLTLRVYPGVGESVLYEDVGEGRGYEQGEFRWVYFTAEATEDAYVLRRRIAGRYEPTYHTIRVEVVGLPHAPVEVRVDRQGAPVWFYDEGKLEVITDDRFSRIEVILRTADDDATPE